MSKYTIELRLLLDSNVNLFDFDYNFVDDEHKQKLEEMFVNHFYFCLLLIFRHQVVHIFLT